MKEILTLSGKGGTGKTSIAACFAVLGGSAVLCDCDVDASNLHLLLAPEIQERHDFIAGYAPKVTPGACTGCGICVGLCRFHAIRQDEHNFGHAVIERSLCEGCGVCADACRARAIEMEPRLCGEWFRSRTRHGVLFHARLLPGEENSGKLIALLRKQARSAAEASVANFIISDGPPGIGCPVIASMSGADLAVVVTEPTVSAVHDLKRVLTLAEQFGVTPLLVLNKCDLDRAKSEEICGICRESGVVIAGRVPYDKVFSEALRVGKTVLEFPQSAPARAIKSIWETVMSTAARTTSKEK